MEKSLSTNKKEDNKLEARIDALEKVLVRMAHYSGVSNTVLIDCGITPYDPSKAPKKRG